MSLKKENGFTLIELSFVLIIFGFVISAFLFAFIFYTKQLQLTETRDSLQNSQTVLETFESENGRLPCPARLDVAPGHPEYGVEMTGATLAANARQGRNDIDGDGTNEQYVFGAIPHMTILEDPTLTLFTTEDLNFAARDGIDGWGSKILYVVSRHLCETGHALAGNPEGVLDVVIEGTCNSLDPGNAGANVPQSLLPGSCEGPDRRYAQFVLVSHGPNKRGAYSQFGTAPVEDCVDVSLIIPNTDPDYGPLAEGDWFNGYANERKNCKYFLADSAGRRNGEFFSGLYSIADDRIYFDDFVRFSFSDEFQIFSSATSLPAVASDGTPYEISRMQNVNAGEIGIGVQDPEEVLHVDGDMQAFDIEAEEYCLDIDTDVCMPAQVLGGSGIGCSGGGAIEYIELNNVHCTDPFAGLDFNCPGANERLKMVRSDGRFECCDPLVIPPVCNTYNP